MKLRFSWLSPDIYKGYLLEFHYTTEHYFHVNATETGLNLEERRFPQPVEKKFTDRLFEPWLEKPVALGAFDEELLVGVIEGSIETWHHVFRISNLLIQSSYRHRGIGRELMQRMVHYAARIPECRGVILETQSCNYPAICFYRSQGFLLNRIDVREYSNEDIQRNEVRLDFYLPL